MTTFASLMTVLGALVLAFVLERHTRAVARLPAVVRALAKEERQHGASAVQEGVTRRVVESVRDLSLHEQALYDRLRAEVFAEQNRARQAEGRAHDTAIALEAALSLVRELRALADAQRAPGGAGKAPSGRPTLDERATDPASPAPPPAPQGRPPLESDVLPKMIRPELSGDSVDDEEVTRVGPGEELRLPVTILPPPPGAAVPAGGIGRG